MKVASTDNIIFVMSLIMIGLVTMLSILLAPVIGILVWFWAKRKMEKN